MKVALKRQVKESNILSAAEKVFFSRGFSQAKMEEVAEACGLSKPTLYFYFKSKEDLYMAITYRAFQALIDLYYDIIDRHKEKNGRDRVIHILEGYLDFSEKNHDYHEALFNYMGLVRTGTKENGMVRSVYFKKIQGIHNLPIDIVVQEIAAGQVDGSIKNKKEPEMIYLTAWALIAGYIKLNVFSGTARGTLHHVSLKDWRNYVIQLSKELLN